MKAFTLKTLLNCGFSQSFCISLMKKSGTAFFLALLPISVTYADNGTVLKDTMKLPYSSQQIDGADLMKVKDANFVNSLIGRVAGATINPSASGCGWFSKDGATWLPFHIKIQQCAFYFGRCTFATTGVRATF